MSSDSSRGLTVLAVASALPPVIGGGVGSVGQYVRMLAESGVHVSAVSGNDADTHIRSAVENSGGSILVHSAPPWEQGLHWESGIFGPAEVIHETLRLHSFDLIHCFSHASAISTAIAVASARSRPAIVATFHEQSPEATAFGRSRSDFTYSLRCIDCFIALSNYYYSIALEHGVPKTKLRQARQGIDIRAFENGNSDIGRKFLDVEDDAFLVVMPSRFARKKGHLELVDAVCNIAAVVPKLRVVLPGSLHGGDANYLEETNMAIHRCGLQGIVQILMDVPYRMMPHVDAAADVVVQGSTGEGLGFAALEAMASGTPLIATTAGGFDEYCVNGENCLLFRPGDSSELARLLVELYRNRDLGRVLAHNAREAAKRYSHEYQVEDNVQIYYDVLRDTGHL
jgi:glycosyltransferase involved in cell wall biosynthesis